MHVDTPTTDLLDYKVLRLKFNPATDMHPIAVQKNNRSCDRLLLFKLGLTVCPMSMAAMWSNAYAVHSIMPLAAAANNAAGID